MLRLSRRNAVCRLSGRGGFSVRLCGALRLYGTPVWCSWPGVVHEKNSFNTLTLRGKNGCLGAGPLCATWSVHASTRWPGVLHSTYGARKCEVVHIFLRAMLATVFASKDVLCWLRSPYSRPVTGANVGQNGARFCGALVCESYRHDSTVRIA